uniref:hypothetical protein n=1 Tax=Paenibacillus sp. FSL R10-2782 TaxID=2954661 RepID=UPI00406C98B2
MGYKRDHAKGLKRSADGKVITLHKITAKISRPEVAEAFLSPAPEQIIQSYLEYNADLLNQAYDGVNG